MDPKILQAIYHDRPFKTRNADEFDLSEILQLFVNPLGGLTTPFDYENSIIKGRMGSGKTMYLRANHAYHLYGILPALQNQDAVILPVLIRLSDFQHINEPADIYRAVIIKIIEELCGIYEYLQDVRNLGRIHMGMKMLSADPRYERKLSGALRQLMSLGADEYVERLTNEIGTKGEAKPQFFTLSAEFKRTTFTEVKQKPNPGIKDIENCYKNLFGDADTKLLLLIDEAGALDKRFFRGDENTSFFEILMNQFRTAQFVRTKIALYPNSYSDILTETRYGDVIALEENVYDPAGYEALRKRTLEIVANYISELNEAAFPPSDVFEVSPGAYGDVIEQLIYASNGNLRRLIQVLDAAMNAAYTAHNGLGRVTLEHAISALKRNSNTVEAQYSPIDQEFLETLIKVCKSRSTFRFQFPYMGPVLSKYTTKSQEFNLITILELGTGRRGTTYAFDYSFCVCHDIPTHYLRGTEKIDKARSLSEGEWIARVTTISQDVIEQANIPGKLEGTLEFVKGTVGFARGDDGHEYFAQITSVIETDRGKSFVLGKRIRFYPTKIGDTLHAVAIEML